ncbi:hypothetical protein [Dysosmobacter sp.]|uniref:hypothetical protein n=1 Tax=Dysosmobacter sp. TaxID=2591382 RepID=UPI003AB3775B
MRRARCERCAFRAPEGADYRCDYCAVTGRTRLAVPPEKCRHFQAGELIPFPERYPDLKPVRYDRRR